MGLGDWTMANSNEFKACRKAVLVAGEYCNTLVYDESLNIDVDDFVEKYMARENVKFIVSNYAKLINDGKPPKPAEKTAPTGKVNPPKSAGKARQAFARATGKATRT